MTERWDVVVIGGGPVGTLYASMLKLRRPQTRVVIVDRAAEPGHKIGESTLSGFCKALRTVGIDTACLQRLFYPKNGLAFLHVDGSPRPLEQAPEYVLETFDETYQVERRVLDLLLQRNAERLGVEVRPATAVELDHSTFTAAGNRLACAGPDGAYEIRCALAVDATGPAGRLSRHLGLRRTDPAPFQTSAVWAYYDGLRPLAAYDWPGRAQAVRDHYTEHLCFREGWLWHIPLVSWQGATTPALRAMLDRAREPAPPARDELAKAHGCPYRPIVSVGLVLRSDREPGFAADPEGTFARYARRYPAIAQLLRGGRLLPDYYGRGRTFQSRAAFRGYAERAAGDGWLLVGDAAFFVDPLISPGLTGGVAGAYRAVDATVRALDAARTDAESLGAYDAFVRRLHGALERDNQLVYMSFNHPRALALVQRFQETYARRHFLAERGHGYADADTNVWGILDPRYQEIQLEAWCLLREAEQRDGDYAPAAARLAQLLAPHLDDALTPYTQANPCPATPAGRRMPC
jgi:flavin-dependent dehydrogenase